MSGTQLGKSKAQVQLSREDQVGGGFTELQTRANRTRGEGLHGKTESVYTTSTPDTKVGLWPCPRGIFRLGMFYHEDLFPTLRSFLCVPLPPP